MPKFRPASVPVQVIRIPGDFSPASTMLDPNPVVAKLTPLGPPPKVRKPMRPNKPKPRAAAPAARCRRLALPDPNAPPPPTR